MTQIDRVDLMNYAVYGDETDPEWEEIRSFIKLNPDAQREFEEIKKSLTHASKKRREEGDRSYTSRDKEYLQSSGNSEKVNGSDRPKNKPEEKKEGKKSWWSALKG